MTSKKTELKVAINCEKCKSDLWKAVSKLQGVDEVTINIEKGTMTVEGSVDPVSVVTQLRKAKKYAEIMSVGPPKKPDPPKPYDPLPICCKQCQYVTTHVIYDDAVCSIL